MMNPVAMNKVAQARRNDVLRHAEAQRRANLVKSSQSRPSVPLLAKVTGLLAGANGQLKDSQAQTDCAATALPETLS